ncbi:MAG: hypothetical protein HYX34_05790 [Actinobacteria bacterium]|nr:hypothetical protein [Actinomycetota bacterium]
MTVAEAPAERPTGWREVDDGARRQRRRRRRIVVGLAVAEAPRLLRQPLVLAGLLLSIVLFWRETGGASPVLQRDSVYVAKSLLPLAVATLFALNLLGLRDRRLGTEELLAAMPHDDRTRWTAWTAVTAVPALLGAAATAAFTVVLVLRGSVGAPAWSELSVGLVLVWLSGLAGLALARWLPSVVAPVALVVLAAVATFQLNGDGTSRSRWLQPFVDFSTKADAIELARRPTVLHGAALAGIAVALGCLLAVRRRRPRQVAAAVSLAGAVAAGGLQLRPASQADIARARRFALGAPGTQRCASRGQVRACLYPGYVGWSGDYLAAASEVLAGAPSTGPAGRFTIYQRPPRLPVDAYPPRVLVAVDDALYRDAHEDSARVGMVKATGSGERDLYFRSAVGMWAAGLPPAPQPGKRLFTTEGDAEGMQPPVVMCSAPDSRPVIGLWLAAKDHPATAKALADLARRATASAGTTAVWLIVAGGVYVEPGQAQAATRLARLPESRVKAVLRGRWAQVRAGRLSVDALARAVGLVLPRQSEPRAAPPSITGPTPPCP